MYNGSLSSCSFCFYLDAADLRLYPKSSADVFAETSGKKKVEEKKNEHSDVPGQERCELRVGHQNMKLGWIVGTLCLS